MVGGLKKIYTHLKKKFKFSFLGTLAGTFSKEMVEERDTGWLVVLDKKGLHQAVEILDNYGIDSETDLGQQEFGV